MTATRRVRAMLFKNLKESSAYCTVLVALSAGNVVCALGRNESVSQSNLAVATVHRKPNPIHKAAITSDWPTLLGPTHNLRTPETHLAKKWSSDGPPLVWEIGKGTGYAAPAVSGGRVVLFHRIENAEVVQCLDAESGREFWRFAYQTEYTDQYGFNNGPRATPVIHDGRVYVYGAEGWLHSLDFGSGKVVWKRQVSKEFSAVKNHFGVGSTPLIEGTFLIINVGGANGASVVAFDKKSGDVAWTTPTGPATTDQWGASYATPVPFGTGADRRVLVFAGGNSRPPTGGLLVVNPTDGAVDFRYPFRSKRYESVNAASAVVVGDSVFLTTAYRTGCVLLDPRADSSHAVLWKTKALRAHFATPVYDGGHLYGFDGSGKGDTAIVCVDVRNGEQLWREAPLWEEIAGRRGRQSFGIARGSLISADGDFLCLGEYGHLLWLDLSPKRCKILSRTRLFLADETWTPPVVSRGLLYICQNGKGMVDATTPRLLCYDLRRAK